MPYLKDTRNLRTLGENMSATSQLSTQSFAFSLVKSEADICKDAEAEFEGTVKIAETLTQEVLRTKKNYEGIQRAYGFYSKFSDDWELVAESVAASATHLIGIAELENPFINLKNTLELSFAKATSLKDLHLVTRSRAEHFTAVIKEVEVNLKFYIHLPFLVSEFNQIIKPHFMGSDFDSEDESVNAPSDEEEYSQVNYDSDASLTSLGEDFSQSDDSSIGEALSSSFTSEEEVSSQSGYISDSEKSTNRSQEVEDLDFIIIQPT